MRIRPHHFAFVGSLLCGCGAPAARDHAGHNAAAPAKVVSQKEAPAVVRARKSSTDSPAKMIFIKGGTFKMGTANGMDFEGPVREVAVASFWMDKHEVTVEEFSKFVRATNYLTEGERIGWSSVFSLAEKGWIRREKVSWRNPDCGTRSPRADEPVTQVSWNDANEYAKWAGKRLPTEAEFEYAMRGGREQNEFAWGNELKPNGKPVANWWQGDFPDEDQKEDGFPGRAPVMSFPPNGFGLFDMAGNVWEWTADFYAADYYKWGSRDNPSGRAISDVRSIRGGSWLCAENYCTNYRNAGRSKSPPDSSLNNLGFRPVMDE